MQRISEADDEMSHSSGAEDLSQDQIRLREEEKIKAKQDELLKSQKAEIKETYEDKIKGLNLCNRLYLWIRRNWVQDILFKTSDDHLDDIVH